MLEAPELKEQVERFDRRKVMHALRNFTIQRRDNVTVITIRIAGLTITIEYRLDSTVAAPLL